MSFLYFYRFPSAYHLRNFYEPYAIVQTQHDISWNSSNENFFQIQNYGAAISGIILN